MPSVEELYETILDRLSPPLPGFGEIVLEKAFKRAEKIYGYLMDRADRMEEDCILCAEKKARRSMTRYAFETPWEDEPVEKLFCSDDCGDIYLYEEPWAYFLCNKCDREICEQNPRNGWHIQYRSYEGETVCLRCYEELILENGVEREKLEQGLIPGMFFSYGNREPLEAGYRESPEFSNFFVRTEQDAKSFIKRALSLMDDGKKVVICYENLAMGGGEGYVTLMAKESGKLENGKGKQ